MKKNEFMASEMRYVLTTVDGWADDEIEIDTNIYLTKGSVSQAINEWKSRVIDIALDNLEDWTMQKKEDGIILVDKSGICAKIVAAASFKQIYI